MRTIWGAEVLILVVVEDVLVHDNLLSLADFEEGS